MARDRRDRHHMISDVKTASTQFGIKNDRKASVVLHCSMMMEDSASNMVGNSILFTVLAHPMVLHNPRCMAPTATITSTASQEFLQGAGVVELKKTKKK